jgi:hypothetical protein
LLPPCPGSSTTTTGAESVAASAFACGDTVSAAARTGAALACTLAGFTARHAAMQHSPTANIMILATAFKFFLENPNILLLLLSFYPVERFLEIIFSYDYTLKPSSRDMVLIDYFFEICYD